MKKEGEKDLEEEVYEVPRLPIKPYRRKLGMAIAQIRERYEGLDLGGLKVASDRSPVDRKTELGYSLEGRLVIFQVLDEPELLKESGPDALATNKLTVEGKIIISFQEILLGMGSDILAIVLQQQLDEVLLISEGNSPLEAQRLAIQVQEIQDRERVEQALKTRLVVLEPIVKELPSKKEELVPKRVIPPPEKKVIDRAVSSRVERVKGPRRIEKKRTTRRKKVRIKKPKKPKILEITTLEQLKNLLTSGAIRRISWHNLPLEIHKALIQELGRETGKETSELVQVDYMKFRLSVLNQQTLGGFYMYYRAKKNETEKSVTRFILEELGFAEKVSTLGKAKTKKELKELLLKGIKMRNWNQINLRIQRSLVRELAWKLGKKIEELIREDYDVLLSDLGEKSLLGLYQYHAKKNKTTKRASRFILEELGLAERTKEIGEIKEPKELKPLLASKAILIIRWGKVSKELQRALVKELAKTVKKEIRQLKSEDFTKTPLDSLNGGRLKDLYLYHRRQNKTKKPTLWYILEELGLVTTNIKPIEEVKSTDELKELLDLGAIRQVPWLRLNKQVQAMLVKELAALLGKSAEQLVQMDYMKVPLPSLAGNTLGGLHLRYSRRNTSNKPIPRLILEELGLVKTTKSIAEVKTKAELKELLISGAIRHIRWGRLDKKVQAALVEELAQETNKSFSELGQLDYGSVSLSILNGRKLGGLYGYYQEKRDQEHISKSTPDFILEELALTNGGVQ